MLFRRTRDDPSPGLSWEEDGPWEEHSTQSHQKTIEYEGQTYLCRVHSSPDDSWRIAYGTPGKGKQSRGFLFRDSDLSWTTLLEHPTGGLVSNQGTVVFIGGGTPNELDGVVRAFGASGESLVCRSFDSNISDIDLSADDRFAAVQTNPPDRSTYLFDLKEGELVVTHTSDWAKPNYVRLCADDTSWYVYLTRSLDKKPQYALDTNGTIAWESTSYRKKKPLSIRLKSRFS